MRILVLTLIVLFVHGNEDLPNDPAKLEFDLVQKKEENLDVWYHNGKCRNIEVGSSDGCSSPGTASCYGEKINYQYSIDSRFELPTELQILENFPSCWERLKNLLCSIRFRPCLHKMSYHPMFSTPLKNRYTQLFSQQTCLDVKEKCSFVTNRTFWPTILRCDKESTEYGKVFSANCVVPLNHSFSIKSKVPFQLVLLESKSLVGNKSHLIDNLYVPCNTAFVPNQVTLTNFRTSIFILTTIVGILFYVSVIIIALNFQAYKRSLAIMFLSIGSFFIIWSISLISPLQNKAVPLGCLNIDGHLIRRENDRFDFNWCTIQSFCLNFLLLNAFGWLNFWVYVTTSKRLKNPIEVNQICCMLSTRFVTGVVMEIGFLSLSWFNSVDLADGLTGVCFAPLSSISNNYSIYFAIFSMIIFGSFISLSCKPNYRQLNDSRDELISLTSKVFSLKKIKKLFNFQSTFLFTMLTVFTFTILLHYVFYFNPLNERDDLLKSVNCLINSIHGFKSSNQSDSQEEILKNCNKVPELKLFDFICLVFYIFALPLMFLILLFALFWTKNWNQKKRLMANIAAGQKSLLSPHLLLPQTNGEEKTEDWMEAQQFNDSAYASNELMQPVSSSEQIVENHYESGNQEVAKPLNGEAARPWHDALEPSNNDENEGDEQMSISDQSSQPTDETQTTSSKTAYYTKKYVMLHYVNECLKRYDLTNAVRHELTDNVLNKIHQRYAYYYGFANMSLGRTLDKTEEWIQSGVLERIQFIINDCEHAIHAAMAEKYRVYSDILTCIDLFYSNNIETKTYLILCVIERFQQLFNMSIPNEANQRSIGSVLDLSQEILNSHNEQEKVQIQNLCDNSLRQYGLLPPSRFVSYN